MNDIMHVKSLVPPTDVSRRGFVVTSLASGFALAVQPVCAQTVITTDTNGLTAGEVKIPVQGGDIPGYRAMPASGGPFATVLVIQEIFGVHEHIKDVCRRFAKLGYFAVAPSLYSREGDVSGMSDIQEIVSKVVSKVPDAQVATDLDAAVVWAKSTGSADTTKLGVTGFCWGGRQVWMYTAHNNKIKAGVSWYGGLNPNPPAQPLTPIDVADKLNAPVLGLYGGADQGIPLDAVERLRAALFAFGKDKESMIHVYEGMPHAFHADYRPSYRKEAAEDGWKRMLVWFKKNGVA